MADVISDEDRAKIDTALSEMGDGVVVASEKPRRGAQKGPRPETQQRIEVANQLAAKGATAAAIATSIGMQVGVFYAFARKHNIPYKKAMRGRGRGDLAAQARDKKIKRGRRSITDQRRFKNTVAPTGNPTMCLDEDHPAVVKGEPIHTHRILHPADPATAKTSILKDGIHNSKIGGHVLLGWLKGARIFTLTLDFPTERKTIGDAIICPEQVDAMNAAETARHCGSCGVCWSCARAVWFVEH